MGETLLRLRSRGKSKWKEVDAPQFVQLFQGIGEQGTPSSSKPLFKTYRYFFVTILRYIPRHRFALFVRAK